MTNIRPPVEDDFKAFEHEGWERVASSYRDAFSSLTTQSIGPLLDAVGAGPGMRLLDVACGPGDATAAAVKRGTHATGMDFAAAMVALATRRHPGVTFRQGDAEALPFDDGSLDAVIINFGVLHFARPDLAIAEAHRVLASGGRLALTVWASAEKCEGMGIVHRAIESHGRLDISLPEGPPFFRFGDPDEARLALARAGFVDIALDELPLVWRLPAPEALLDAFLEGGVRTRGMLKAQTPQALEAIRAAVTAEAARRMRGDLVELAMPATLTAGVKR
jgi:SAM-dependent methyltransferase